MQYSKFHLLKTRKMVLVDGIIDYLSWLKFLLNRNLRTANITRLFYLNKALALATKKELDLVEIVPQSSPPVCKLIDYGKYKYKLQKKESEAEKNQLDNAIKELKVRYFNDIGDLKTKLRHVRSFLSEGNKVKFSMRFKGREKAFVHLGKEKLQKIASQLSDVAKVYEQNYRGRTQMQVILVAD